MSPPCLLCEATVPRAGLNSGLPTELDVLFDSTAATLDFTVVSAVASFFLFASLVTSSSSSSSSFSWQRPSVTFQDRDLNCKELFRRLRRRQDWILLFQKRGRVWGLCSARALGRRKLGGFAKRHSRNRKICFRFPSNGKCTFLCKMTMMLQSKVGKRVKRDVFRCWENRTLQGQGNVGCSRLLFNPDQI